MKAVGVACDVCDKFAQEPDDWFKVSRGKASVDVCSAKCLCALGRQTTALDEAAEATHACKKCDKAFATQQGLSMHDTRTHRRKR